MKNRKKEEAIQTIQNYLNASVPVPYSCTDIVDKGDDDDYRNERVKVIPSLLKSSTSSEELISEGRDRGDSKRNLSSGRGTFNFISDEEIIDLLESIKDVLVEMLDDDYTCIPLAQNNQQMLFQDDFMEAHNDDEGNSNYNREQLGSMIRDIFQLLVNSMYRGGGGGNSQLFQFLFRDILKGSIEQIKIVAMKHNGHRRDRREEDFSILFFIMDMIPMVIHHDVDPSIENELIDLVLQCLFPSWRSTETRCDDNSKDGFNNTKNLQQVGSNYKNMKTSDSLIDQLKKNHEDKNQDLKITKYISSSASSASNNCAFESIQSIVHLFQRYPFKDKKFVLQIFVDYIFPKIKALSGEIDTSSSSDGGIISMCCSVFFTYLKNHNMNNVKRISRNTSKIKGRGDEESGNEDLELVTNSLTSMRSLFITDGQQLHKKSWSEIELNVIRDFIPFLVESSSIATGYKAIIRNCFGVRKNPVQYKGKEDLHQDKWSKLDVCAFLIGYHVHSSLREDMKSMIQNICNESAFPFGELQSMLEIEFMSMIDEPGAVGGLKASSNSSLLRAAILEMGLYLVLTPIRDSDYPRDEINNRYFPHIPNGKHGLGVDLNQTSSEMIVLHPTLRVLFGAQSLIQKLYPILSTEKKQQLMKSLLFFSCHVSFIPTMMAKVMKNDSHVEADSKNRKTKQPTRNQLLPFHLDRYLPRNEVKSSYDKRHVYDVSIICLNILHNIVLKSSLPQGCGLRNVRKIVLDRLDYFATTACDDDYFLNCHSSTKYNAVIMDEILMQRFVMAEVYCSLLVILSVKGLDDKQRLNYCEEIKLLCHKLLVGSTFSFTFTMCRNNHFVAERKGRHDNIAKIVGVILGSTLMQSPVVVEDEDKRIIFQAVMDLLSPPSHCFGTEMVEQKIDPLLGYWGLCFLCSCCPDLMENDPENLRVKHLYSVSDIFKFIKKIVSLTGLVKLESDVLIESNLQGGKQQTVVAYQRLPSCFQQESKRKRNLVFTTSSLLKEFIDRKCGMEYLGIETIQFVRYIHALIDVYLHVGRLISPNWSADTWLSASVELYDVNEEWFQGCNDLRLMSYLLSKNGIDYTRQSRNPLSIKHTCTLSFLFSITILRAVLTNAHSQFSVAKSNSARERLGKLILLGLAKLYDLRSKFQLIAECHLGDGIESQISESSSLSIVDDIIHIGAAAFGSSIVPLPILWTCINGEMNNFDDIGDFLFHVKSRDRENIICELWLKSLALQDLQDQLVRVIDSMSEIICKESPIPNMIDQEGVGIILQNTIAMMRWLPSLREVQTRNEIESIASPSGAIVEQIKSFLSESLDFLQVAIPYITFDHTDLQHLISHRCDGTFTQDTTQTLSSEFTGKTFQIDDPYISGKMLDFATLLSTTGIDSAVEKFSTAHWNQFLAVRQKHGEGSCKKLPLSFALFLKKELEGCYDSNKSGVLLHLFGVILSPAQSYNDHILRYHLCAHWANTLLNGSDLYQEYQSLLQCLQRLINEFSSDVMVDTTVLNKYVPIITTSDSENVPIESISFQAIPLIYESVLSMCSASFILKTSDSYHSYEISSEQTESSSQLVNIFGSLVELYTSNFQLFPDSTLGVTIQASSFMITSFEIQIDEIFKTRQGSKSSSPRKNGKNNASRALQPIFDCIQANASIVINFCNAIPAFSASTNPLELRCQGILTSLNEFNNSYNYFQPSSLECLSNDAVSPLTTSRNLNISSDNQTDIKTGMRSEYPENNYMKRKRKLTDDQDSIVEGVDEESGDSSDSDSFGALGDW